MMTDAQVHSRKPLPTARRPVLIGLAALLVLVAGFGGWSILTTLAGAVVSSGQIEVASQQQIVQHPDGGVVERIHVKEGGSIDAGGLILTLDGTFLRSELAVIEGQFFETLARRGRLEAERDLASEIRFSPELIARAEADTATAVLMTGQMRLFGARATTITQSLDQLGERRKQIASQIAGVDAQLVSLTEQQKLIGQELDMQNLLFERGLTQITNILALQREAASLGGDVGELRAARAEAEGKITEIRIQELNLRSSRQEEAETELRDLGDRELELAEKRRSLVEQIARLEIRAPVSGIVHGLQVTTPRSVLRSADPVVYLIPQDQPLVITALIQPTDISNVHPGQRTILRFPSFPSRTTPELDGTVTIVSADAFQDEQTNQSFYRAQVVLDERQIERLNGQVLIPGMPVEVMLMTVPRTPLEYLVKPLADYFAAAFRES